MHVVPTLVQKGSSMSITARIRKRTGKVEPRTQRNRILALAGVTSALVAGGLVVMQPAAAAATCDRAATPSTLSSQVSAATAGQSICLAAGDYGTWAGTNKAVTLRAEAGVSATMKINFTSGDTGFTLDGLSGMGGTVRGSANNFTIRNSKFTSTLDIQGSPGANIIVDSGQFDWPASYNGSSNAKLFIYSSSDGASSGVTVRNSTFRNGDLDGIHIGGSAGADIIGNVFDNLCASGTNHTDMLQTEGMVGGRIAGNIFRAGLSCEAQALTSYDGGTKGVIIEDNVIDVRRPWGIEWYADNGSIIRHNTVVYYPPAQCNFNTTCGQIDINRKSQDSAGTGTQVYDNLTTRVNFSNGSTGSQSNNVSSEKATYVGPTATWAGFKLASTSVVGLKAASDGLDAGVRVSGSTSTSQSSVVATTTKAATGTSSATTTTKAPTTSPTATTTTKATTTSPTATSTTAAAGSVNIPADAVWTVPSGVITTATPVTLDGTRSTGNGPLTCTWSFENQSGTTIWETLTGCKLVKTFKYADTKYVKLIVRDANGDTDSLKLSFPVRAA